MVWDDVVMVACFPPVSTISVDSVEWCISCIGECERLINSCAGYVAPLAKVVKSGCVVAAPRWCATRIRLWPLPLADAQRSVGKRHSVENRLVVGYPILLGSLLSRWFGPFSYLMVWFYWPVVL